MVLQTAVLVDGVRTELVVQPYADRVLVLVTQMGKVGNLIQASVPSTTDLRAHTSSSDSDLPCPSPAIQLTPLFGSAPSAHMHTLYSLYAAQTATLIWLAMGGEPRSIVVGIALKGSDREQQTFHAVMGALQTMLA